MSIAIQAPRAKFKSAAKPLVNLTVHWPEMAEWVEKYSLQMRMTKSQVIKEALFEYYFSKQSKGY